MTILEEAKAKLRWSVENGEWSAYLQPVFCEAILEELERLGKVEQVIHSERAEEFGRAPLRHWGCPPCGHCDDTGCPCMRMRDWQSIEQGCREGCPVCGQNTCGPISELVEEAREFVEDDEGEVVWGWV